MRKTMMVLTSVIVLLLFVSAPSHATAAALVGVVGMGVAGVEVAGNPSVMQCVANCIKQEGKTATIKKICKRRCADVPLPAFGKPAAGYGNDQRDCMTVYKSCNRTCAKGDKACRRTCKSGLMQCK